MRPEPCRESVIGALLEVATPILDREFKTDRCILSTRVAIEVLAAFGVTARPQPVSVLAFNPEAYKLLEEGTSEQELAAIMRAIPKDQPGGPWSVGVICTGEVDRVNSRYTGHLVALVDRERPFQAGGDVLIDLSLPQVNRPHKHIQLGPLAMYYNPAIWDAGQQVGQVLESGTLVTYERANDTNWATAPDWTWPTRGSDGLPRRQVYRQLTGMIIRAMRAELGASK